MRGGLGPLQSEAATGVLTIVMSEVDEGTLIVWEYAVGGPMRYETPVISRAVDGVMSQQLGGLADLLGRVDAPRAQSVEPDADGADGSDAAPEESVEDAIDAMGRGE